VPGDLRRVVNGPDGTRYEVIRLADARADPVATGLVKSREESVSSVAGVVESGKAIPGAKS